MPKNSSLPNDTLLDIDPIPGISPEAINLLKIIYLEAAGKVGVSYSPTSSIDAFEGLRRKKLIEIVEVGKYLIIQPTETGLTAVRLLAVMDHVPIQGHA